MPKGLRITHERSRALADLFIAFTNSMPMWKAQLEIARFIKENFYEPVSHNVEDVCADQNTTQEN